MRPEEIRTQEDMLQITRTAADAARARNISILQTYHTRINPRAMQPHVRQALDFATNAFVHQHETSMTFPGGPRSRALPDYMLTASDASGRFPGLVTLISTARTRRRR